ncbi:MAG: hypothetical protein ACP5VC_17405 [Bryobacteraceae bacterium]
MQPFQMTGRQLRVRRALSEKSAAAAELYECALRVLSDGSNPGRLVLAAHAIREMTGGLPKSLDLPILADQGRLRDQVSALGAAWAKATRRKCHSDGNWAKKIDGPLRQFLKACDEFFQWYKQSLPKRRDVAAKLFKSADPSGMPLPETLEKSRADRWLELHDYFVRVAHQSSTTEAEFQSALDNLEQVLLDLLYPRPSEDFSAIDALLAEENPNA